MKYAALFIKDRDHIIVSAEDVKNGLYSRNEEFVDPKYEEYRVQYVKGAKNNGGPYFRLYWSYEQYKKMYPDRADRYEIVSNMRRFSESEWHKRWKKNVSDFCTAEKYIKNPDTGKWKFADAFYDKTNTCIEFQHSYINWDFEERNKFYSDLSVNTVWLYDLPNSSVRSNNEGNVEILEDNARGFFRISENSDNLKNNRVYIQVKSGAIYRVIELLRHKSPTKLESTIRYFKPTEVYSEEEFINAIKNNTIGTYSDNVESAKTIQELWNKSYYWMIVKNIETGDVIKVNCNGNGEIFRKFSKFDCIQYVYVDEKFGSNQKFETSKEYSLSHEKEKRNIWVLIDYKSKQS